MEPAQNSCEGRTLAHAIEIDVDQSRLQRQYTIHTRIILPAGQRYPELAAAAYRLDGWKYNVRRSESSCHSRGKLVS